MKVLVIGFDMVDSRFLDELHYVIVTIVYDLLRIVSSFIESGELRDN